jgi:hypothetical protein
METRKLLKKPREGQIVKVYKGMEGVNGVDYGVAVHTMFKSEVVSGKWVLQEKVVLKPIEKPSSEAAIDFFLPNDKVLFNKFLKLN